MLSPGAKEVSKAVQERLTDDGSGMTGTLCWQLHLGSLAHLEIGVSAGGLNTNACTSKRKIQGLAFAEKSAQARSWRTSGRSS